MDLTLLGIISGATLGFATAAWLVLIAYDIGTKYRRFEHIALRRERRQATRAARSDARVPTGRVAMSSARDLR